MGSSVARHAGTISILLAYYKLYLRPTLYMLGVLQREPVISRLLAYSAARRGSLAA